MLQHLVFTCIDEIVQVDGIVKVLKRVAILKPDHCFIYPWLS